MPTRLHRRLAILNKLETTYGTNSTPGAVNAIVGTNVSFTPLEAEEIGRDLHLPHMGHQGVILTGQYAKIEFDVEIAGAGAAGTVPKYGSLLRAWGEELIDQIDARKKSAQHESRWLNLAGFCLRPGYGFALDDWRISRLWPLSHQKPAFPRNEQCRGEWWILWRRAGGGLSAYHQKQLAAPLIAGLRAAAFVHGGHSDAGNQPQLFHAGFCVHYALTSCIISGISFQHCGSAA